jgi:Zn finger protein HypA/HybF involved in hydrogenase expression
VNLFAVPFQCPKCKAPDPVPYDHPRLSGRPGDHVVAAWRIADQLGRELSLNDGEYKCPKCKNMTLRFSGEGVYWD